MKVACYQSLYQFTSHNIDFEKVEKCHHSKSIDHLRSDVDFFYLTLGAFNWSPLTALVENKTSDKEEAVEIVEEFKKFLFRIWTLLSTLHHMSSMKSGIYFCCFPEIILSCVTKSSVVTRSLITIPQVPLTVGICVCPEMLGQVQVRF